MRGNLWDRFDDLPEGTFRPLVLFIATLWWVQLGNFITGYALNAWFALVPRSLSGLDGVVLSPFLHGGWRHLIGNTAPLLVLGVLMCLSARQHVLRASILITLIGNGLVWLLARPMGVVGASGLLCGWFGFLVARAVYEHKPLHIVVALVALALYGGPILLGVVPLPTGRTSWEAHGFGLMAGWLTAALLSGRRVF